MLSLLIPFRDKCNLLENCLSSIKKSLPGCELEIILINNNSKENDTFKYLDKLNKNFFFKTILLNENSNPFNYAKAINYGVEKANFENILLLNNDVEIKTNLWGDVICQLLKDKKIGLIGSKLINHDGTIQHLGIEFDFKLGAKEITEKLDFENSFLKERKYFDCKAITGAFMAFRKETFKSLGGMNQYLFPLTFNDVHLSLKSIEKGFHNICIKDIEIVHIRGATRNTIKKTLWDSTYRSFEKIMIKLRIIFHLFKKHLNAI